MGSETKGDFLAAVPSFGEAVSFFLLCQEIKIKGDSGVLKKRGWLSTLNGKILPHF